MRWLTCFALLAGVAHADELQRVSFELGASEFHDGDAITISELRCDKPELDADVTCRVTGHYVLKSEERATLLFSVTETGTGGNRVPEKSSMFKVERGEGQFSLVHKLFKGYPHLTFYNAKGAPVSGQYFGHGDSLLKKKSWPYNGQANPHDHLGP